MKKFIGILLALYLLTFLFGADQPDFPDIYIDESVAPGGVGSLADPYSDFSEINWTTGGDNSIFDWYAGAEDASVRIRLQMSEEWREQLTIGESGSATYPIIIRSYGSGADPIINAQNLVETWTANQTTTTLGGGSNDATADNTVSQSNPATNYDAGFIANQHVLYYSNDSATHRILQRWDITSIPDGNTITVAKIQMYCTIENDAGGLTTELYSLVNAPGTTWEEDTSTWNTYDGSNAWTGGADGAWGDKDTLIGTKDFAGADPINTWYDWNFNGDGLTYLMAQLGGNQVDVLFHPTGTADADRRYFYTKDQSVNTALRPKLAITHGITNVWQAALTTSPNKVYFDGVVGTHQTSAAACTGVRDWYWTANVLYTYSESDPDDAYTSPGIETSIRAYAINMGQLSYLTIEDLDLRGGTAATIFSGNDETEAQYCVIQDNTITRCDSTGGGGIAISGQNKHHWQILNNEIGDNYGNGIYFGTADESDGGVANNTISGNYIHEAGEVQWGSGIPAGRGIYAENLLDSAIYQNKIINCSNGCIKLNAACENVDVYYNLIYQVIDNTNMCFVFANDGANVSDSCQVYNNVMYQAYDGWNNTGGYGIRFEGAQTNNVIKNNIIYTVRHPFIHPGNNADFVGYGNTFDNNCYYRASGNQFYFDDGEKNFAQWQGLGFDANGMATDPLFIDVTNEDFRLLMASPCVDAGTDVSLLVDYLGILIRHAPDIGAYEEQTNAVFMARLFKYLKEEQ